MRIRDWSSYVCSSVLGWTRHARLVRGLDYYRHTAFEFVTDRLGAQGTVLAGGRYDGLIEALGGPETPGVGWAAGIERLAMLIDAPQEEKPHVDSEEHTSELQSLMRTSYADFCLKKQKK